MDPIRTVHECLFCSQTFDSAIEKDDHTLEHFAQEICTDCNRNLIRIGSNLYTKHTTETCIKHTVQHHHINERVKSHSPIGIEVNDVSDMKNESFIDKISSNSGNSHIGNEFEPSNIPQDPIESVNDQIKTEEKIIEANDIITQGSNNDDEYQIDGILNELDLTESQSQKETGTDEMKGLRRTQVECDICGKIMLASSLVRHKGRCHNFCLICTKILPDSMDFIQHKRECIAEITTKGATNQIIDKAADTVIKPTHDCSICKSKLKTRASYRSHMRYVHPPDPNQSYECSQCSKQFKHIRYLNDHVCRFGKGQPPRVYINPKKHIIDGRYVCDICNGSYASRSTFRHHKIVVHKVMGANTCKWCATVFPTEDELILHRTTCRSRLNKKYAKYKPKIFECDICESKLKGIKEIRRHMESVHIKEAKRFKCDECGFKFRHSSKLTAHHKLVHLKVRDFICTVCGEAFQVQFQLTNHMHKHSGEKFKCRHENCEKYFDTPVSLKNHIQTHGVRTKEDVYKCDLCESTYARKTSLQSHHKFVHLNIRNHKCMICNELFKSKSTLQNHMYKHTGEKPFSCPHSGCERTFRYKGNLREHYRMHTGEKPFLCEVDGCQQRFRYTVDFRRHKLKIHGIPSKKRK